MNAASIDDTRSTWILFVLQHTHNDDDVLFMTAHSEGANLPAVGHVGPARPINEDASHIGRPHLEV